MTGSRQQLMYKIKQLDLEVAFEKEKCDALVKRDFCAYGIALVNYLNESKKVLVDHLLSASGNSHRH